MLPQPSLYYPSNAGLNEAGIPFWKYAGCGNDFILIDNREQLFPCHHRDHIRTLCHRNLGVGADGIILLEESDKADARMRIFNADGSEAEMCGNGIRCLASLMRRLGWEDPQLMIETLHRVYTLSWEGTLIRIAMGAPSDIRWQVPLDIDGRHVNVHYLNSGVPHAILFVERVDTLDVERWGRLLRYHHAFAPAGANANFARIDPQGRIWLRTYERGVEKETLACGTGATATALAAAHLHYLKGPIRVHVRSGDTLTVDFTPDFHEVTLAGPASFIYQGVLPKTLIATQTPL